MCVLVALLARRYERHPERHDEQHNGSPTAQHDGRQHAPRGRRFWRWHASLFVILGALVGFYTPPGELSLLSQRLLLLGFLYAFSVSDGYTLRVDLRLLFLGLALRGSYLLWYEPLGFAEAFLGATVGCGTLTLIALAYRAFRGRVGLGEGDAALLAFIGAFVGWEAVFPVLILAAAMCILCFLPWFLLARLREGKAGGVRWDRPLPFVPFLSMSGFGHFFWQTPLVG